MKIYDIKKIPEHLKQFFEPAPQLGLEETPEQYVANMVQVFREVRRVLKDDGVLWLNLGDSYARGFGGGTPGEKSQTNAGSFQNRKPGKVPDGLKPKDLIGIPWMVAFALRADGWYLRQDIIWHKPNPMPESVTDRCTKAHEYIFLLSKSERYFYDAAAIAEKANYQPGGSHDDVPQGGFNDKGEIPGSGQRPFRAIREMRNRRSVWTIPTQPYAEAHFAVFPPDLIVPCIKAGSKPGDVVLDPFFGSGTTGEMALRLERQYVGFEINQEYVKLAEKRLYKHENNLFTL